MSLSPENQQSPPPLDPKLSKERAEETENKIVEESVAAGVPAFKFNPDAPPSAKREQVKEGVDEVG